MPTEQIKVMVGGAEFTSWEQVTVRAAFDEAVRNFKTAGPGLLEEATEHLWAYYERVALNRGIQGSRNTGVPMTYGEAYQRLFPTVEEVLK